MSASPDAAAGAAGNEAMGPPPLDFDFSATPGYKGYLQRNLNIALISFSTFFIILRLGTRAFIVKGLGLDDLVGFIAYAALVSFSSMEIRGALSKDLSTFDRARKGVKEWAWTDQCVVH